MRARIVLLALAAIFVLANCRGIEHAASAQTSLPEHEAAATGIAQTLSLIPEPALLERTSGTFEASDAMPVSVDAGNAEVGGIATRFIEWVQRTRGLSLRLAPTDLPAATTARGIVFMLDPSFSIANDASDEGYDLTVTPTQIRVVAHSAHGLFNGATTVWQLLTADTGRRSGVSVPCLHIQDHPGFAWRGLMLDPARHFQTPGFVKQFIDAMALHKFNVLHWHLTDDQGWRIEIKKYPKLTEIGAWRRPPGAAGTDANGKPTRYGGFYTQQEIRDIVAYAQQRYVTIVPEIEMPGHAQAAIASYPRLGVTGRNPGVSSDWGIHTYLYNVDDSTFIFLQDVLTETMALFPSPYIHIGGDEAAKDQWHASGRIQQRMHDLGIQDEAALQGWFIHRIETFLDAHGRKLIGWDEILEGGLPPHATVMSWRGTKGAIDAAKQGHDVVLSPDPELYFDHLPGNLPDEPAGRPSVISLQDVYRFTTTPKELDAAERRHVLGAQANLWSEYFPSGSSIERAAFPRAAALAEVLWTPQSRREWPDFLQRMIAQQARYRSLGIAYAQSPFAVAINAQLNAERTNVHISLSNQTGLGEIRYTLNGSEPTEESPRYDHPFDAPARGEIRAVAFSARSALADAQARLLDPKSLLRRESSELATCHPGGGAALKLPEDTPAERQKKSYLVDLFDACWIWPQAKLDGIDAIVINTAALPYNFQLWKDAKNIIDRPPQTYGMGELQVRLDGCEGTLLSTISLAPLLMRTGGTELSAAIPAVHGDHDLCLRFATGSHDPLRVIDWVQLVPKS